MEKLNIYIYYFLYIFTFILLSYSDVRKIVYESSNVQPKSAILSSLLDNTNIPIDLIGIIGNYILSKPVIMIFNPPTNNHDVTSYAIRTEYETKLFIEILNDLVISRNDNPKFSYSAKISVINSGTVMEISMFDIHELYIKNAVGLVLANCLFEVYDLGDAKLAEIVFLIVKHLRQCLLQCKQITTLS